MAVDADVLSAGFRQPTVRRSLLRYTLACMDTLTFIAKLVEFLAWPGAVVLVVLLLKKDIQRLLNLLRKVKAGPVEAEFEAAVEKLEQRVVETPGEPPEYYALKDRKLELMRVAEASPRAAVLEAWRDVEAAVLKLADTKAVYVPEKNASVNTAARALAKEGHLPAEWVSHFYELRELRNKAAHSSDFNPTLETAAGYIELTARVRARLEAAARKKNAS